MKWTFGIPTNGQQDERIISILTTLLPQISTENYEVLICGNSKINLPNCRVIPFEEHPKIWITKKKNILCSQAQFENICLFHDYFTFAPNWYESFLQFGNQWDVAICNIKNKGGGRLWCWIMEGQQYGGKGRLDFSDTSHVNTKMYCSGGWYCVKKLFAMDNPLDERLMWGEAEDLEWSRRCRRNWNFRINTSTFVQSLKQK